MGWSFTTQSRDRKLVRPIQPQYGTIQRPRRLRLRSSVLLIVEEYSDILGCPWYRFVMGNPAGVRRDFDKLERRRLDAVDLLRQGIHQAEVARLVGAHRQSVNRWARQLEQGGKRALRKAGRAGRKPRLTAEDRRRWDLRLHCGHPGASLI